MEDGSVMALYGPKGPEHHVLWCGICPACAERGRRCTAPDDKNAAVIASLFNSWPVLREAITGLLTDKERLAALAEAAVDYIDVNVCDSDTTAKMRVAWERLKPLLDQYRSSGESPMSPEAP
jgi:hypothetical protein